MAEWKSFTIEIPGKDLLEPVRNILEQLLIVLEILKAVLETIKAFLVDFGNPLRALIEALIKLIEELFLALASSGMFMLWDFPEPWKDPNFTQHKGGFNSFLERFKGSLFDSRDFNRPQPRQGSTKSGFVLLVITATNVIELVQRIMSLMRFFGKEFFLPRFEAPENFKAIPVGAEGDPILRLADTFTSFDSLDAGLGPIKSIQLQWTLPSSQSSPDPGFSDVFTKLSSEFIPPSWVIEKAVGVNPTFGEIEISEMSNPEATGLVKFDRQTQFQSGIGGKFVSQPVKRKEQLRDNFGENVIKFQQYIVASKTTTLFGQLGKFRFLDNDVEPGVQYYYRVRAFFGDLDVDGDHHLVNPVDDSEKLRGSNFGNDTNFPAWRWPGKDVIMGVPSPLIQATIGNDLGDFDAFGVARDVFKTAFSLDFHQPLAEGAEFDEDGRPVNVPASEVGKGSLLGLGDALVGFQARFAVNTLGREVTVGESFAETGPTGKPVQLPYQNIRVRFTAARLAGIVVSAMMQDENSLFTFRDLMRGPLPRGDILPKAGRVETTTGMDKLEQVVRTFVEVDEDGNVVPQGAETFFYGYENVELRLNILNVINFFKSFTLGGVPPDWLSVVPLRDIIPWGAQLLYDLLDKIQALLDAFNGIIEEIKNFIDLLIRKIDALEEFIQFLISILEFIESLSFQVSLLNVGGLTGDAQSWIEAIDNATGEKPPNNPGDYSCGVALAYVAPDVAAFETAFTLIFGPTG